jgi:hypothetical protein
MKKGKDFPSQKSTVTGLLNEFDLEKTFFGGTRV